MFNAIFIRIIILAEYFKSGIGENCPASQIIGSEANCNSAADVLGLSFSGSVRNIGYPAGCYWSGTSAFFNKIIDPSQTIQNSFGGRGGVCVVTDERKNIISK